MIILINLILSVHKKRVVKQLKENVGKIESADKPGSVLDNHSSRRNVTIMLKQPTRIQREAR